MSYRMLLAAGLALAACDMTPGPQPSVEPTREAQFVELVEGAGCELPHTNNDYLLDPAGFGDAEASAISQQLLADGRAEVSPEGNLVLRTENCI
jgi:hypothetical protein